MSIAGNYVPSEYAGNGVTTNFGFGFPFFAAGDIVVVLFDTVANALVNPQPALNGAGQYDFHVNAAFDPLTGEAPNGSITFNNPLLGNHRLDIRRNTARLQPDSFALYSPLNSKTVESAIDRMAMIIQELDWEVSNRVLIVPASDPNATNMTIPAADARANDLLGFDANGNPIAVANGGGGGGGGGGNTPLARRTVNANYVIGAADNIIFVDTSGGPVQLTLPANHQDPIIIIDDKGTFNANNCTVVPDTGTIFGAANLVMNVNWQSETFYFNPTGGNWRAT